MSLEKYTLRKISSRKSTIHAPRANSDYIQAHFSKDQATFHPDFRKSKNFPSLKFSKMQSGKGLEIQKNRRLKLRNTCDQTALHGSFIKNEFNQILELQRQLSQISIHSLSEKKKTDILGDLIKVMSLCIDRHEIENDIKQLEEQSNEKNIKILKKDIDTIQAWKNKIDNENKVALAEILKQRKSRVDNSKIFHEFQQEIKKIEEKYLVMISRSQTMKRVLKNKINNRRKDNGQNKAENQKPQLNSSEKNHKNRKFVSIKTKVSIEEASSGLRESCDRNTTTLKSMRMQTFRTIWSKHNRIQNKCQSKNHLLINTEEQVKNLVTNCIFGIFQSKEEKIQFFQLKIKQMRELLELEDISSDQIVKQIQNKEKRIKKENNQMLMSIDAIEKEISKFEKVTSDYKISCEKQRLQEKQEKHEEIAERNTEIINNIFNILGKNTIKYKLNSSKQQQNMAKNLCQIINELLQPVGHKLLPPKLHLSSKIQQYDSLFLQEKQSPIQEKLLLTLKRKPKKDSLLKLL